MPACAQEGPGLSSHPPYHPEFGLDLLHISPMTLGKLLSHSKLETLTGKAGRIVKVPCSHMGRVWELLAWPA